MDGNVRRTRFETRIALERDFLSYVNKEFGASAPLAGMTLDAIESWAKRAASATNEALIFEVAALLTEVSKRADLMADNSKDVFDVEQRPKPDSLAELRSLLELTLARVKDAQIS